MTAAADPALLAALSGALSGHGPAHLAALNDELLVMLRREPTGTPATHLLLAAQAVLYQARATRH